MDLFPKNDSNSSNYTAPGLPASEAFYNVGRDMVSGAGSILGAIGGYLPSPTGVLEYAMDPLVQDAAMYAAGTLVPQLRAVGPVGTAARWAFSKVPLLRQVPPGLRNSIARRALNVGIRNAHAYIRDDPRRPRYETYKVPPGQAFSARKMWAQFLSPHRSGPQYLEQNTFTRRTRGMPSSRGLRSPGRMRYGPRRRPNYISSRASRSVARRVLRSYVNQREARMRLLRRRDT